jgi:hypothetical protein
MLAGLAACSAQEVENWKDHQQGVIRIEVEGASGDAGRGSGFSISDKGFYITNWHVVSEAWPDGAVTAVESTAPSLKLHPAEIVWHDKSRDLALIKVGSWPLPPYEFISSAGIDVNTTVYSSGFPGSNDTMTALGSHPADTVPTLKKGIISETLATQMILAGNDVKLFEHEATVNPGNSGGPLFDACGRVVGVNVAKAATNFDVGQAVSDAIELGRNTARLALSEGAFYAVASDEVINGIKDAKDKNDELKKVELTVTTSACGSGGGVGWLVWLALLAILVLLATLLVLLLRRWRSAKKGSVGGRPDLSPQTADPVAGLSVGSASMVAPGATEAGVATAAAATTGTMAVKNPVVGRASQGTVQHVLLDCSSVSGPPIAVSSDKVIVVGRDPNQCDVVLSESDKISRCHASLTLHDGAVVVLDLGSTWGTRIESESVPTSGPGVILLEDQNLMFGSEDFVYQIRKPATQG